MPMNRTHHGSDPCQGKLQCDLWGVTPSNRWNWDDLRGRIVAYGLRNSLLTAPMPTASTSQVLGNTECIEPLTSNIYVRRVLAGEFAVVNRYLIDDLLELDLWNDRMKNEIIAAGGSIQRIPSIPEPIKKIYRQCWEIPQRSLVMMAADRGPYIDQSQSLNLFIAEPTLAKLTSMHFFIWKRGLKGSYYLRTQAAVNAIQFTVDKTALSSGKADVAPAPPDIMLPPPPPRVGTPRAATADSCRPGCDTCES